MKTKNPSADYFRKRELEHIKKQILDDKEYEKRLIKMYNRTMNDAKTQIDAFIGKYANEEGLSYSEAKKKINSKDVEDFAERAAKYVKDRDFSDRANEELRLYNLKMRVSRLELLKREINLALIDLANAEEKELSERLKDKALEELKRQSGILGMSLKDRKQLARDSDKIVNADFHSATFSDRIWANQEWLQSKLADGIERSILRGEHPREWSRRLYGSMRDDFKQATNAANRIAVTETARVQAEVQQESRKIAGYEEYVYIAEPTACPICAPLDGKVFKAKDMKVGINHFPMHPWCKCSSAAHGHVNIEEQEQDKSTIDNVTNYEELNTYLTETYDIKVDKRFKDMNIDSVKGAFKGIELGFEQFPEVKKLLKSINIIDGDSIMGYMPTGELFFNGKLFKEDPDYFAKEVIESDGFWIKNASQKSMGIHEFGHMLEHLIVVKNETTDWMGMRIDPSTAMVQMVESEKIVGRAHDQYQNEQYEINPDYEYKSAFDMLAEISGYAKYNVQEGMAEAFTDFTVNGDKAHPLSKKIVELIKKELMK